MANQVAMALRGASRIDWKLAMDNAVERTIRFGKEAAAPLVHGWRPPIEDEDAISSISKAAGVPRAQIIVVPPAKFVYDREEEVPIRVTRALPPLMPPIVSRSEQWTGPRVIEDLQRYHTHRVMQDVYDHVKLELRGRRNIGSMPSSFARSRTGIAMLKTFERLGNVRLMQPGTCCFSECKARWSNSSVVVVDAFVESKYKTTDVLWRLGMMGTNILPFSLKLRDVIRATSMVDTGMYICTVPRKAFENNHYKVVMAPHDRTFFQASPRPRLFRHWLETMSESNPELPPWPRYAPVKISVEIDRRVLGLGTVVFFEPPEAADDLDKVWQRVQDLGEDVFGCLDGLKLVKSSQFVQGSFLLLPEFMEYPSDVPYVWGS